MSDAIRSALLDIRRALGRIEDALGPRTGGKLPSDLPDEPEEGEEGADDGIRMPFGKYKGKRVSGLEPDYCAWLLANIDIKNSRLAGAIRERADEG